MSLRGQITKCLDVAISLDQLKVGDRFIPTKMLEFAMTDNYYFD